MATKIVTANRLRDGLVVYLGDSETWSQSLAASKPVDNEAAFEALLAAAERAVANGEVIEPYLIDVETDGDDIRPTRFREVIRATGPTVPAGDLPLAAE
jgi:hypothetical protein